MVMDGETESILWMPAGAEKRADVLTETALAKGGRDNVTALVLQMKNGGEY